MVVNQRMMEEDTLAAICPSEVGVLPPPRPIVGTIKDFEEWRDFLERWDIPGPLPVNFTVTYRPGPNGLLMFYIQMRSFTQDASEIRPKAPPPRPMERIIVKTREFAVDVLVPTVTPVKGATDRWLRALARWWYLHELDEWIRIDGKRPYDPHVIAAVTPENCG